MREVVIVEAVRTPIGKHKGALSATHPQELAAHTLKELIKRTGISPKLVEDVIFGVGMQVGQQSFDLARVAALIADFPIEVPGVVVERQCGSGQQAIHFAAQAILSGDMDVVIAGGVESMTHVLPMAISDHSQEYFKRYEVIHQGVSAERVADKWGISRTQLDEFSIESHRKAVYAQKEGRFEREIAPIEVTLPDGTTAIVSVDEGPRGDTSLEKLAKLKPVFQENGKIHAGNSSQISDGAAAVLIMSRDKAEELELKPRARIISRSVVGSDPTLMLTGPIAASKKALEKAGLTLEDMDLYEVNEAFAPVPLVWAQELGADLNKLNVNGGAVALGHPIGGTGARIMTTLLHELERSCGRYGLMSICEGHGQANATIIERL
ncbi:thiolase family protein [Bacillus sp. AFS055030]|uniref:thiolase family protein n=1 Tax=Bacillus sp. AFS055030 TaxID=2033507 RepID=UPI000BFC1657|nr:thiolase family protein [Bacillus sp. AFS055030]PGL70235.1 acetyl-CoA C-acyltransferase [Bacillus sp. AFS055030]